MSKTFRWLCFLVALILFSILAAYALQCLVIIPSFVALEHDEAVKDLTRCFDAIAGEAQSLDQLCADWAIWDDTYQFAQDRNEPYLESNVEWESLESNSAINLLIFCRVNGEIIWGGAFDSSRGGIIEVEEFSAEAFSAGHYLLAHDSVESKMLGVVLTSHGPMLISSRPILKSDEGGPIKAVIIMGRFLSDQAVKALADQTRVPFQVKSVRGVPLSPEEDQALTRLANQRFIVDEVNSDELQGYGVLVDLKGNPALLVETTFLREIMKRGKATARVVSWSVAASLVLFIVFIVLWYAIRLQESNRHAARVEMLVEERSAELRQSKERMTLALEGANLGTWDWNIQTGAMTLNERCAQMLGYTLDEMKPHMSVWEDLVHPDDQAKVVQALDAHLEGRTNAYETEHRLKHKSGKWIWIQDKGRVLEKDAEGNPLRACGTQHDITNRKKADEVLRKSAEELERRVEARTAELTKANKALQKEIEERLRAEKALLESLERFETVMNSLDTPVHVIDFETYEILFINRCARDLWGDCTEKICWQTLQSNQP